MRVGQDPGGLAGPVPSGERVVVGVAALGVDAVRLVAVCRAERDEALAPVGRARDGHGAARRVGGDRRERAEELGRDERRRHHEPPEAPEDVLSLPAHGYSGPGAHGLGAGAGVLRVLRERAGRLVELRPASARLDEGLLDRLGRDLAGLDLVAAVLVGDGVAVRVEHGAAQPHLSVGEQRDVAPVLPLEAALVDEERAELPAPEVLAVDDGPHGQRHEVERPLLAGLPVLVVDVLAHEVLVHGEVDALAPLVVGVGHRWPPFRPALPGRCLFPSYACPSAAPLPSYPPRASRAQLPDLARLSTSSTHMAMYWRA